MKILNLYAGLGGNRTGFYGTQLEVVAVEKNERVAGIYGERFPGDVVVIADAHQYLLDHYHEFDFIWSSPPCQSHSRFILSGRNQKRGYIDLKLYQEIIFLQTYCKVPWVVENVIPHYTPLVTPARILGRHCLWSNFKIGSSFVPRKLQNLANCQISELKQFHGIEYTGSVYLDTHSPAQALRNCVDYELARYVFSHVVGRPGRSLRPAQLALPV